MRVPQCCGWSRTGAQAAPEAVLGPDLPLAALELGLRAGQGSPGRVPLLQQQIHLLQGTHHSQGYMHDLQTEPSQKNVCPASQDCTGMQEDLAPHICGMTAAAKPSSLSTLHVGVRCTEGCGDDDLMLVHGQDALEGVGEQELEGGEDQRRRVGQPVGVPGAPELRGRRALLLVRTL